MRKHCTQITVQTPIQPTWLYWFPVPACHHAMQHMPLPTPAHAGLSVQHRDHHTTNRTFRRFPQRHTTRIYAILTTACGLPASCLENTPASVNRYPLPFAMRTYPCTDTGELHHARIATPHNGPHLRVTPSATSTRCEARNRTNNAMSNSTIHPASCAFTLAKRTNPLPMPHPAFFWCARIATVASMSN